MQDPANELPRINLLRLFGKSEWVTNRGCESGQDGPKESLSAASYLQTSALETPSAIFQTVSRKEVFCEVRVASCPSPMPLGPTGPGQSVVLSEIANRWPHSWRGVVASGCDLLRPGFPRNSTPRRAHKSIIHGLWTRAGSHAHRGERFRRARGLLRALAQVQRGVV